MSLVAANITAAVTGDVAGAAIAVAAVVGVRAGPGWVDDGHTASAHAVSNYAVAQVVRLRAFGHEHFRRGVGLRFVLGKSTHAIWGIALAGGVWVGTRAATRVSPTRKRAGNARQRSENRKNKMFHHHFS